MPNGVSSGRPPANDLPPSAVWQTWPGYSEQERIAGEIAMQLRRGWRIERVDTPIGPGLHTKIAEKKPD